MWTKINLEQSPIEFQQHINDYLSKREDCELLQVIEITDKNNIIDRYSAYLFIGNMCVIISMWYGGVLHGKFNEDSMIIGEMKEFIKHPKLSIWFRD